MAALEGSGVARRILDAAQAVNEALGRVGCPPAVWRLGKLRLSWTELHDCLTRLRMVEDRGLEAVIALYYITRNRAATYGKAELERDIEQDDYVRPSIEQMDAALTVMLETKLVTESEGGFKGEKYIRRTLEVADQYRAFLRLMLHSRGMNIYWPRVLLRIRPIT